MMWLVYAMGVATGGAGTAWALSLGRLLAIARRQEKANR